MNYTKFEFGAYNIHFIKTDKFKTINMFFNFRRPIKREEITIRNVLIKTLLKGTKKFRSTKEIAIHGEELYNSMISVKNERIGNYLDSSFNIEFLNDKYTPEPIFDNCVDFLLEVIFNPMVDDNKFDAKTLMISKSQVIADINSMKDDTMKYGLIKMLEAMGKDQVYSYQSCGYLDDLEKIDTENLYEYYIDVINKDLLDIYVLGDIDVEEVKQLLIKKIPINTMKKAKIPLEVIHNKLSKRLKKVKDYDNVNQAKLSIGCKYNNLTDFEKKYVINLYSVILGGNGKSLLFENVREKKSLAYYCSTKLKKPDNLLFVVAGINQSNFNKTLSLIKKQFDNIKKGNFDSELIDDAKKLIISSLQEVDDNQNQIISDCISQELLKIDSIDERIKKIGLVTKQNIIDVAKKISIDTVHLLYGDDRDE